MTFGEICGHLVKFGDRISEIQQSEWQHCREVIWYHFTVNCFHIASRVSFLFTALSHWFPHIICNKVIYCYFCFLGLCLMAWISFSHGNIFLFLRVIIIFNAWIVLVMIVTILRIFWIFIFSSRPYWKPAIFFLTLLIMLILILVLIILTGPPSTKPCSQNFIPKN